MLLKPCDQCRRHVSREAARCPFCDGPQASLPARVVAHAGRVSRAAVFAGLAACGSATPAPNHPPPPPPPDPMVVQQIETAPAPVSGKTSVRGFVTIDGRPLAGVKISARNGADVRLETTSGAHGEYAFVDIDPGEWIIEVEYEMPRYRPQDSPVPTSERVMLAVDVNERRDIPLMSPPPPAPDRGPCCKPYGAPPARRRIV